MKKILALLMFAFVFAMGCAGADTTVKKDWEMDSRSLAVVDMTNSNDDYLDASSHLLAQLEESVNDTIFVLNQENPTFKLKFKVTDYREGSRLTRMATFGASDSARAELQVKAALYQGKSMLGAWEVNTWVNGGMTGGSEDMLFKRAADEIITHMKGSY